MFFLWQFFWHKASSASWHSATYIGTVIWCQAFRLLFPPSRFPWSFPTGQPPTQNQVCVWQPPINQAYQWDASGITVIKTWSTEIKNINEKVENPVCTIHLLHRRYRPYQPPISSAYRSYRKASTLSTPYRPFMSRLNALQWLHST